jgi:hypothetical protein
MYSSIKIPGGGNFALDKFWWKFRQWDFPPNSSGAKIFLPKSLDAFGAFPLFLMYFLLGPG